MLQPRRVKRPNDTPGADVPNAQATPHLENIAKRGVNSQRKPLKINIFRKLEILSCSNARKRFALHEIHGLYPTTQSINLATNGENYGRK